MSQPERTRADADVDSQRPWGIPRVDLARRVSARGILCVPGALQRAGNAAVCRRLGRPGPSRPLAPMTRETMETVFGADVDRVRLHDDAQAGGPSAGVEAMAVTDGADRGATADLATALGHVFATTATWIGVGAGLGAGIGGLAGGGLGAVIGAVIGGGAGLLGTLVRRVVDARRRNPRLPQGGDVDWPAADGQ